MRNTINFLEKIQIKDLESKGWDVTPEGFYMNLYKDEFQYEEIWEQICRQININPDDTDNVTLLCIATAKNIGNEELEK